MNKRYECKKISHIFSQKNRLTIFTEIERLTCLNQNCKDSIIEEFLHINVNKLKEDLKEKEKETKHETVAFVYALSEQLSKETQSYLHKGITSSDILDNCLAVQMKQAGEEVENCIVRLMISLKEKAVQHKYDHILGRSHGMTGEITTFGLILLGFYKEWERNLYRMKEAVKEISFGKVSGAMGNFVHIQPTVEKNVCKALGLDYEPISTQVIPRDRHAFFMCILGILGSSMERLALEVRNLSQTLIEEVAEGFGKDQTGSSAMPHKRNPILSENITGLARMIRSYVQPSLENVSLWYERDMSHSSVERIALVDSLHLVCFGLRRLTSVIDNLYVNTDQMNKNIEKVESSYLSQSCLIKLMEKGYPRKKAYKIVQEMTLYGKKDLKTVIYEIQKEGFISLEEAESLLNLDKFTDNVDAVFNRCFKS